MGNRCTVIVLLALVFVTAGCPRSRPVGPPSLPPVEPGELTWAADDSAFVDASGPIAVDGDRLIWASVDGAVRAAPLAGGPATVLVRFVKVAAIAVTPERIYVLGDDALWALAPDGAIVRLAKLRSPTVLAVCDAAIYVGDGDWIRAIPLGGGAPVTLATDAGAPVAIACDAAHVYWADGGEPERDGSIRRVAIGGGAVESRAQVHPRELTLHHGHVYWTDAETMRADLDLANVEVVFGASAAAFAVDDTSSVMLTHQSLLVEIPAAGAPAWTRPRSDGALWPAPATDLALTADTIYESAPASDNTSATGLGYSQLLRFPRGPGRLTTLAVTGSSNRALALAGDQLYYLDGGVMRVPRGGGATEAVRADTGDIDKLAVHADHVITSDWGRRVIDAGAPQPLVSDVFASAIAVDDRHVYWAEGPSVLSAPVAGGPTLTLYEAAPDGAAHDYAPGTLIVEDGVVVAAGKEWPGLVRIDTRPAKTPHKPEVLAAGATDVAIAGDRLLAWTPAGLISIPGDVVLLPAVDGTPDAITADATDAWVVRNGELIRVPLDGGAIEVVVRGLWKPAIAVDADAVYVADEMISVVLRYAKR